MSNLIAKQKSHAFGKDVFLLGTIDGKYQWLEAPKWDCGWYWGFGYVEEYTSHKSPSKSKDIICHTHIDSLLKNKNLPFYELDKVFEQTTFNEKEKWKLAELFKQFYLLREMADFTHHERLSSHITISPVDHGDLKEWNEKINKEMIPKITDKILDILTFKLEE